MNVASRIHGHFHQPEGTSEHAHGDEKPPFWVRRYDRLVKLVSLGRVGKLHRGTLGIVGFEAGNDLLDIGCGTGELVLHAASRAKGRGTVVGLDVEVAMIAQAQKKAASTGATVLFAEASITAVPYPDESFDVITSSLMFHHLTPEEQTAGLAELHRVLRPNGRLAVVDINSARPSLVSRFPGHRHLEAADPVQEFFAQQMRDAGFESVTAGAHPFRALSYAVGTKP